MEHHDDILVQALSWAKDKKPDTSPQHQAAFANSVATIITGWSGGYGGPSMREHAATRQIGCRSDLSFDEVCSLVEPVVFGPLTEEHRIVEEEYCFDDDPSDLAAR